MPEPAAPLRGRLFFAFVSVRAGGGGSGCGVGCRNHDAARYRIIGIVRTTRYFEEKVLKEKRPYLRREWCEWVVRNPVETEEEWRKGEKRIRHWAYVEEMRDITGIDKYLLVVTLRTARRYTMPCRTGSSRAREGGTSEAELLPRDGHSLH